MVNRQFPLGARRSHQAVAVLLHEGTNTSERGPHSHDVSLASAMATREDQHRANHPNRSSGDTAAPLEWRTHLPEAGPYRREGSRHDSANVFEAERLGTRYTPHESLTPTHTPRWPNGKPLHRLYLRGRSWNEDVIPKNRCDSQEQLAGAHR